MIGLSNFSNWEASFLIYLIPIISAFIGWLTNFFAIKMLFHPRKRVKLLFFSLQGIIPANQIRIAERLSETITSSLLSEEEIKKNIVDNHELDDLILKEIDDYMGSFIKTKLVEMIPMASMFLGDDLIDKFKNMIRQDLKDKVHGMKEHIVQQALEKLDLKALVREKIEGLSLIELENVLMGILKKEFRFVEVTGAVVGFLIGGLQLIILYL